MTQQNEQTRPSIEARAAALELSQSQHAMDLLTAMTRGAPMGIGGPEAKADMERAINSIALIIDKHTKGQTNDTA